MKYLVMLLLIGLAVLEFFHHLHDSHAPDALTCAEPQATQERQRARELLQHHLYSHR